MRQLRGSLPATDGIKACKTVCGAHAPSTGSTRVSPAFRTLPSRNLDRRKYNSIGSTFSPEHDPHGGVGASRRSLLLFQLAWPLLLGLAAAPPAEAAYAETASATAASSASAAANAAVAAAAAEQTAVAAAGTRLGEPEDAGDNYSGDEDEDDLDEDGDDDGEDDEDEMVDEDSSSSSSSSSSGDSQQQDLGGTAASDRKQDPPSTSGGSSNSSSSRADPSSTGNSSSGSTAEPSSSDNGSSTNASSSTKASSSSSNGDGNSAASRTAGKGSVSSNLSVKAYLQILRDARRASWPLVAQKIASGSWIELSQVLVQPPFDDVRQACFYIPWALLQSDDFTAAVAARKAYVDFIDHVHALAAIALKAADGVPGAGVQVQQSFLLLNASVDAFLAAVPPQYNGAAA